MTGLIIAFIIGLVVGIIGTLIWMINDLGPAFQAIEQASKEIENRSLLMQKQSIYKNSDITNEKTN